MLRTDLLFHFGLMYRELQKWTLHRFTVLTSRVFVRWDSYSDTTRGVCVRVIPPKRFWKFPFENFLERKNEKKSWGLFCEVALQNMSTSSFYFGWSWVVTHNFTTELPELSEHELCFQRCQNCILLKFERLLQLSLWPPVGTLGSQFHFSMENLCLKHTTEFTNKTHSLHSFRLWQYTMTSWEMWPTFFFVFPF